MPSPSEMSVLFFIGILIGGRGSILGPALGTIILTVLPEFAAATGAVVDVPLRGASVADRSGDPGAASPTCSTTRTAGRSSSIARLRRGPSCWRACSASAAPARC
jgi:hypothetical protein